MTTGRPYVGPVREIRVDDATWAEVERFARLGGVSASRWVRDAIVRRLNDEQNEEEYRAFAQRQSSDRISIDQT